MELDAKVFASAFRADAPPAVVTWLVRLELIRRIEQRLRLDIQASNALPLVGATFGDRVFFVAPDRAHIMKLDNRPADSALAHADLLCHCRQMDGHFFGRALC